MFELPGFHLGESLLETAGLVYFHAVRQEDKRGVLVKALKAARPTLIDKANFKNEYEVTRSLSSPGIFKPLAVAIELDYCALVLEDFSGRPPDPHCFWERFGCGGFLRLALQAASILREAHEHNVVHHNLRPCHLWFDENSLDLKITGFLVSSPTENQLGGDRYQEYLEALTYMSPEQSGRLNRAVDHYADFYGLGLTFYELLTGAPPFAEKEAAALIHCHLAREPEAPGSRNPELPCLLSDIVVKLLNKTPEDRYHGASGLVTDLRRCLEQWSERGRLRVFALGARDVSPRFQVSQKLYGRHKHYESLTRAVEAARQGKPRFQPLAAPSGMGKSSLVRRFFKHQSARPGYYVAGNFARQSQNVPYRGLFQALRELVTQIVSESTEALTGWRVKLLNALGDHIHALVEVVPEVSWIIGDLVSPPARGSRESQNRFRLAMVRFIEVFAQKDHPLVLFLDDLQWADDAGLDLIQDLMRQDTQKHLLVIGAYRSEEVPAGHPLNRLLGELWREGIAMPSLSLQPLDLIHIQELLRDTLGSIVENPRPLAEFLLRKTEGNPFFVRFLMRSLFSEGLIRFDAHEARWSCTPKSEAFTQISRKSLTDLILNRVQRLSPETQYLLGIASCFGNRFQLNLLADAAEGSLAETAAKLGQAVEDEILVPSGETYKLLAVYDPAEIEALGVRKLDICYHFQHDRIQHAVYGLLASDRAEAIHRLLGGLLLMEKGEEKLRGRLFDAANQLNKGQKLLHGVTERLKLAELNLAAGEKAKNAMAFQHARGYFRVGLSLLPEDAVQTRRDLWFAFHLHLAETEYFAANAEAGELHFRELIAVAASPAEWVHVHGAKLLLLNNLGMLEAAVAAGLEGLARLGIEPPAQRDCLTRQSRQWLDEVLASLRQHGTAYLLELPLAEGESVAGANRLLMDSVPPAYNTDQQLFKWLALFHIRHVLEHGCSVYTPHAVAVLGILAGERGDYRTGYELGQAALELNRRLPDPLIEYKLVFIGCNLLNHWRRHPRHDLPKARRVFDKALARGDLVYANYSLLLISIHQWLLNRPLLTILDESERHAAFASLTRNVMVFQTQRYLSHVVLNLRGLTKDARHLDSETFQERECLRKLREIGYLTGLSWAHVLKMQVLYLRGYYERALQTTAAGEELIAFNQNTLVMPPHYFFKALILAETLVKKTDMERAELRGELDACLARFECWAESCPETYRHQRDMIRAEISRIEGDILDALQYYRRAKAHAAHQGFILYAAIADERATSLLAENGLEDYAHGHLISALEAYDAWGATAKSRDLAHAHAALLERFGTGRGMGPESARSGEAKTGAMGGGYADALDMATLAEAARTISGEIKLEALYTKMLRLVVENAGAQRGVLILHERRQLVIVAEWRVDEERVRLLEAQPLEAAGNIARSMVYHVLRTRAELVLRLGDDDPRWAADPYLPGSGVRALACAPIIRQTEPLAILYLEHASMEDAFHRHRLEMLRLLAPQIGIAFENARFIANMDLLNQSLRQEIGERKKAELALKKAQRIALMNERNAGKAEFANSVLHNIRNVLNSVLVSCDELTGMVERSRLDNLARAADLLIRNRDHLATYLREDPKGKILPEFLQQLGEVLRGERQSLSSELAELNRRMALIEGIIQDQQTFAKNVAHLESIDLILKLEEVLDMQREAIEAHRVEVQRQYRVEEPVRAEGSQLSHILINLVKNALEAMGGQKEPVLSLTTGRNEDGAVFLEITDRGSGISALERASLFSHGYTTKREGHGFGLHYCAKAMREMGGTIQVTSEGRGKGATFRLTFAAQMSSTK